MKEHSAWTTYLESLQRDHTSISIIRAVQMVEEEPDNPGWWYFLGKLSRLLSVKRPN